jgi:DNA-binding NtrC family response regulator
MRYYEWPGNIRELENLVKRYTIVGNEGQIIRELATHKPILSSTTTATTTAASGSDPAPTNGSVKTTPSGKMIPKKIADLENPSLLEIGRRAAIEAEQDVIEKVLRKTRWNRRQAAKLLNISYKSLLNKLKLMEENEKGNSETFSG